MHKHKHVTIIGGGVVGLACAYYLKLDGHQVRIVEQKTIGDSCAKGNAGYVSPSHFIPLAAPGMVRKGLKWMFNPESPFYIRPRLDPSLLSWMWKFNRYCNAQHVKNARQDLFELCTESKSLYLALQKHLSQPFQLANNGIYALCHSERAMEEELKILKQANELGMKAEEVSTEDVSKKNADMNFNICGGVYFPEDSHVQPSEFMASLYQFLIQNDVEIVENFEVNKITESKSRIISIASKTSQFDIDELIIATGSWSSKVCKQLNFHPPIQAGKGYSMTIDKTWDLDTPMILSDSAVAITPFDNQIRFGGTMEFAGLDLSINERRVQGIMKSVKTFIPDFDLNSVDIKNAWAGLRPVSPDGLPLVGKVTQYSNLMIAAGHAMLGLTLAPVTGQIITDLMAGRENRFTRFLDPDRF